MFQFRLGYFHFARYSVLVVVKQPNPMSQYSHYTVTKRRQKEKMREKKEKFNQLKKKLTFETDELS